MREQDPFYGDAIPTNEVCPQAVRRCLLTRRSQSQSQNGSGNRANALAARSESLRIRFHLTRSHDEGLVPFKGTSSDILRALQGLLREFGFAELSIRHVQLIMDVAVMIQRGRLLESWNRIGKLSHAHVCRPQEPAGFIQVG